MVNKRTDVTIVGVLHRGTCGQCAIGIAGTDKIGLSVNQLAGTPDIAQSGSLKRAAIERAVIRSAGRERLRGADLHPQRCGTLDRLKTHHTRGVQHGIALTGTHINGHRRNHLDSGERRDGGDHCCRAIGGRHTRIIGRGTRKAVPGDLPQGLVQQDAVRIVHRGVFRQF